MKNKKCHFCKHDRGRIDRSDECAACRHFDRFQLTDRMTVRSMYEYQNLKAEEEWANDKSETFDRPTALAVLKALSNRMHPSTNLFGDPIFTIDRYTFELIRKKFLD